MRVHNMNQFNGIDCLKFLMAISIVGCHACLYEALPDNYFGVFVNNITGLCVPIFFVISSFFFFRKIRILPDKSKRKKKLWQFEKRVMVLYLFWIIVQLPYIIYLQKYQGLSDIFTLIKDIFFGSTFIGSWFLGAMITGMPIVFLLTRNKYSKTIITCLICFVYIALYQQVKGGGKNWYREYVSSPFLSFPRGMFWLMIGYYVSSDKFLNVAKRFGNIGWVVAILFIPVFIPYEYWSIPTVILIFILSINIHLHSSPIYHRLRIYSIIIYCSHGTMLALIGHFFHPNALISTLITIVVCSIVAEITYRLSQRRGVIGLLKYSY